MARRSSVWFVWLFDAVRDDNWRDLAPPLAFGRNAGLVSPPSFEVENGRSISSCAACQAESEAEQQKQFVGAIESATLKARSGSQS
jgi:hypothetical protein